MPELCMDAGREMIVTALGDRLAPGVENFSDMFCDDGVLETPFDGDGTTSPVEGEATIRAMLRGFEGVISLENLRLEAVHQTTDGDTVIHEYDGVVRSLRTGQRLSRSYVALPILREGRLALLRAFGGPLVPIPWPGSGRWLDLSFRENVRENRGGFRQMPPEVSARRCTNAFRTVIRVLRLPARGRAR